DSGANERPPMLEKGNYIPWESRFRIFLDNKLEEGERMWRSIEKGPFVRPMILDLDNNIKQIIEPLSKMTKINKKQYIADVRIMNYLLQAITNDIYNLVDASKEGESLESVYERLTMLVNIMDRNNVHPIPVSINTKFLNCLQPEWRKYVTMRDSKIHDPLALIAHSNASSSQSHASQSYSNSPQPYYVTHPSSVVDYEEDYQGKLQGNQAVIQDGRVDIQSKNVGYGGNSNRNARRKNMNQAFNAGNGLTQNDETDDNAVTEPNYDAKAVSEVNASHIMIPKWVHEHKNHGKHKTVVNTSDDDQIDSNIIFDDPYVENNGGSDEHDSNVHDQYHDVKIMAYNVQREAENKK
ncbi:hypothetical protein Tco_0817848, partial [Tanacetum coccineum]